MTAFRAARRRFAGALPLLVVGLCAACRVGPDYRPPEVRVADSWHRAATAGLDSGEADLRTWWTVFGDARLEELIARVDDGNLDLEIAAARVREARALRRIVEADRVPTVDAVGSAGVTESSRATNPVETGSTERYRLGAQATWELDVWGRVASSVDAAIADVQATEESMRDLRVLLYAEVALSYVELRTAQERFRLASENVETQESTLRLVRDRFEAQLIPELDVRQAEMNLARTQSLMPSLRRDARLAAHRLAVLLGEEPGALYDLLSGEAAIPDADGALAVGIPADVLRRRPDVRRAERELAAQTARIGVAEADLYPRFSLAGDFGWEALKLSDLLDSSSNAWGIAVPFRWNLFDRGRIHANIEAQEARAEALQSAYERTILLALEEVEGSMVALASERERLDYLERSVTAASQSVELVRTLYTSGLKDFQPVLDSERTLAEQQDAMASSRGALAASLVSLYTALGGGWDATGGAPPDSGADGPGGP